MTLEELDAELAAARASLERLRANTIAEFTAMAEVERNPYFRDDLLAAVERVRAVGTTHRAW